MAVVLVTGASSGFGQALVTAFARRGDDVVATMRRPDPDNAPWKDDAETSARVDLLPLDVLDARSREAAVQATLERHGRIDVLVNNAGIMTIGAIEDTDAETVASIMATNVTGPLELTRAVLPTMRAQGGGRIVNVTAIGAILCTPFLGVYAASKHACDALSVALDAEVRPFGIRVVSVLPGLFKTSIGAKRAETDASEPYRVETGRFERAFLERLGGASDDLNPVADMVMEAATSADPAVRYLVGTGVAPTLQPAIDELARLHEAELDRLGLVPER